MPDIFREENERRFPVLEQFRREVLQPLQYGMNEEDCFEGIKSACEFFKLPLPEFIYDLTERRGGHTMFVDRNPTITTDDILCYNLEELKYLGATSHEAFTLVMTHECGHRYLQNKKFQGFNDGSWEEELCCDFFMGVRAGLYDFSRDVVDSIRNGLERSKGCYTHPSGFLRKEVIFFGYRLGHFDFFNKIKSSPKGYKEFFDEWLKNKKEVIYQEQIKLY